MRLPGSLVPDPQLRTAGHGRFLIGGSPATVLTLSSAGATTVRSWFAGAATPRTDSERRLADRLEHLGVGSRCPRPPSGRRAPAPLAVVIPVRDDATGVVTTLRSLAANDRRPDEIVVVDDRSAAPHELAEAIRSHQREVPDLVPVRVERRDPSAPGGGPGVARNTGIEASEVVRSTGAGATLVMVDAGVALADDTLGLLEQAIHDGAVAVAPRITSVPGDTALDRYEVDHSPLDLGDRPAIVRPGGRVAYVPSAVLALRVDAARAAIDERGWLFDPSLRYGEDVDLVWRVASRGTVRYLPTATASHPPRSGWRAFVHQRMGYGSAAGPLAERHGAALAPLRLGRSTALAVASLAAPGVVVPLAITAATLGVTSRRVARTLPGELPDRGRHALALVGTAHGSAFSATGAATLRAWWPLAAAALLVAPAPVRRLTWRLLLIGAGRRARSGGRAIGIGMVDDLAYCAGVWRGVFRRTENPRPPGPLAPRRRAPRRRARRRAHFGALRPVLSD